LLADIEWTLALARQRTIDEKHLALEALRSKMIADQERALDEAAVAAQARLVDAVNEARAEAQEAVVVEKAKVAQQLKEALAAAVADAGREQRREQLHESNEQAAQQEARLRQEHALLLKALTAELKLTKEEAATALSKQREVAAQATAAEVKRAMTDAVSATAVALAREHGAEMARTRTNAQSQLKKVQGQADERAADLQRQLTRAELRGNQMHLASGLDAACSMVDAFLRKELESMSQVSGNTDDDRRQRQVTQYVEEKQRLQEQLPLAAGRVDSTSAPTAAATAAAVAATAAVEAFSETAAAASVIVSTERLASLVRKGLECAYHAAEQTARGRSEVSASVSTAAEAAAAAAVASELGVARAQLAQLSLSPQQLLDAEECDLCELEGQLAVVLQCVRTVRKVHICHHLPSWCPRLSSCLSSFATN
jgi:hypothetical protein